MDEKRGPASYIRQWILEEQNLADADKLFIQAVGQAETIRRLRQEQSHRKIAEAKEALRPLVDDGLGRIEFLRGPAHSQEYVTLSIGSYDGELRMTRRSLCQDFELDWPGESVSDPVEPAEEKPAPVERPVPKLERCPCGCGGFFEAEQPHDGAHAVAVS